MLKDKLKNMLKNKRVIAFLSLGVLAVIASISFLTNNNAPVEAFVVSEGPFAEKIIAIGQLGLENETTLIAQTSGDIHFVNIQEGEVASSGAILFEIENQVDLEYSSAKSEFDRANSRRSYTGTAYENALVLYKEGAVSENEMKTKQLDYESALSQFLAAQLTLQRVEENLSQYSVAAPWDAVVLKTYVSEGDYVQIGEPLADIGGIGGYIISAELDEKYFPYIQKGLPVLISLDDGYSGVANGMIDNITPKINANTGTFEINILLPNDYPYKASNLTVNIEIKVNEKENAIAIPQNYIFEKLSATEAFVLVYKEGKAAKVPIRIQSGISSMVIVSEGILEGDILLLPQEGLQEGDAVKKYKEASAS
ncbi:MAG: efflux RND transporter periplasmic adaptor subunit [Clostridia bacterium]|nr:efflux RND transporter periplasmic adaptor subunit [Clostridia bacterium]